MNAKYSQKLKDIINLSKDEAIRLSDTCIRTEHLFLGLINEGEGTALDILISLIWAPIFRKFVLRVTPISVRLSSAKMSTFGGPSSVEMPTSERCSSAKMSTLGRPSSEKMLYLG